MTDENLENKRVGEEEKRDNRFGRLTLVVSLILATMITYWHYEDSPPDTREVREMRMFFKKNINKVMKFIQLPYDEIEAFAAQQKHPFYKRYIKASEVEKEKIRALIHVSSDYNPRQYWFNTIFLWAISLAAFWFLGLITQACLILSRQAQQNR